MCSPLEFIFVYGTLRKDADNAHVMSDLDVTYIGPGVLPQSGGLNMHHAARHPWPILCPAPVSMARDIHGDVFLISQQGLRHLDVFEDTPHDYARYQAIIRMHDQDRTCWVYVKSEQLPDDEVEPVILNSAAAQWFLRCFRPRIRRCHVLNHSQITAHLTKGFFALISIRTIVFTH